MQTSDLDPLPSPPPRLFNTEPKHNRANTSSPHHVFKYVYHLRVLKEGTGCECICLCVSLVQCCSRSIYQAPSPGTPTRKGRGGRLLPTAPLLPAFSAAVGVFTHTGTRHCTHFCWSHKDLSKLFWRMERVCKRINRCVIYDKSDTIFQHLSS